MSSWCWLRNRITTSHLTAAHEPKEISLKLAKKYHSSQQRSVQTGASARRLPRTPATTTCDFERESDHCATELPSLCIEHDSLGSLPLQEQRDPSHHVRYIKGNPDIWTERLLTEKMSDEHTVVRLYLVQLQFCSFIASDLFKALKLSSIIP